MSYEPQALGKNEAARTKGRNRRAIINSAGSAIHKFLAGAVTIITVPLTLHYLGLERYGVWVTMSSVIAIMSFVDLGIGNGILSAVSDANGKDDQFGVRKIVS